MSGNNKPEELTDIQKKRVARIKEIIGEHSKGRKESKEKTAKIIDEIKESFDSIIDTILFNCDENERATIAETLIETLLIRMTLKGYIMAGLVEYIKQKLVTQPLASYRLLRGKQMIADTVANIQRGKKDGDMPYIR